MTQTDTTPRHPIRVVAQRTGLSPDVLRVWERRYGAVEPGRGPGGQRLYSDADVARLQLLTRATAAGRSIGSVARAASDELAALVAEDTTHAAPPRAAEPGEPLDRGLVEASLTLARALDQPALDAMLRRAAAAVGVERFLEEVAGPVLRKVGDEWHAGRLGPAHEHLASSVVEHIISDTLLRLQGPLGAPRIVIATPAGERHAIGAASAGALAAAAGWQVVYLGADLPAAEVADAAVSANARLVAISMVHVFDRDTLTGELRELRRLVPATVPIWAGGPGAMLLKPELDALGLRVSGSLRELAGELRAAIPPAGYSAR